MQMSASTLLHAESSRSANGPLSASLQGAPMSDITEPQPIV